MRAIIPIFLVFFLLINSVNSFAQENHPIIVDSVRIEGNRLTKPFVIYREVLLKKDSIYNSKDLDDMVLNSKNLLINTNLFITVDVDWVEVKPNHVVVNVVIREKWYIWPIPLVQLADRNFKQWANLNYKANRINYGVYLFIYNYRGRNETLKFTIINGYTRHYGIQYIVPFLDKTGKLGLDVSTSYKKNSEIWYLTRNDSLQFFSDLEKKLIERSETKVALITRRNNFATERLELEYNLVKVNDTILEINPAFLLSGTKQKEIFVRHVFHLEKRDNRFYPLIGFYFRNELALGSIQGDTSSIELLKESVEYGVYKKVYKKVYLSGFVKAKFSNQAIPFIPYNNYKSFGYKDFVRGYEQYVMDGSAFTLAKFNVKYALLHQYMLRTPVKIRKKNFLLPTGIYFNSYADWGKVWNDQWQGSSYTYNNTLINTNLFGYGVGTDILFLNDRIFRFEYSLNIKGDRNFNIHFEKAF